MAQAAAPSDLSGGALFVLLMLAEWAFVAGPATLVLPWISRRPRRQTGVSRRRFDRPGGSNGGGDHFGAVFPSPSLHDGLGAQLSAPRSGLLVSKRPRGVAVCSGLRSLVQTSDAPTSIRTHPCGACLRRWLGPRLFGGAFSVRYRRRRPVGPRLRRDPRDRAVLRRARRLSTTLAVSFEWPANASAAMWTSVGWCAGSRRRRRLFGWPAASVEAGQRRFFSPARGGEATVLEEGVGDHGHQRVAMQTLP